MLLNSAIGVGAQEMQSAAAGLPRSGERVRVTTPSLQPRRQIMLFIGVRNDLLFLRTVKGGDSAAFPIPAVTRFDVSQGVGKPTARVSVAWGIAGLVGGVLVGSAIGRSRYDNSTGCGTFDFFGCQEQVFAVLGFGLVGGLAGGTMAFNLSRRPRERWRTVQLDHRQ